MTLSKYRPPPTVNRHTGGLENCIAHCQIDSGVNRHTGGLENIERVGSGICCVNRHTGGLEIAMWGISIAHYR